MGQYYIITNLTTQESFLPHDLGEGLKLMEFSYFVSETCTTLCKLLSEKWNGSIVIVCGDYFEEPIPKRVVDLIKQKHNIDLNKEVERYKALFNFAETLDKPDLDMPEELEEIVTKEHELRKRYYNVKTHEERDEIDKQFDSLKEDFKKAGLEFYKKQRYFVNYDKELYIDLYAYFTERLKEKKNKLTIEHPVPLLLALGNGLGGGDYEGWNEDEVGSWAWDKVGIVSEVPSGFAEDNIIFKETMYGF